MSDGKFLTPKTTDSLIGLIADELKPKVKWWLRGFVKQGLKIAFTYLNKGGDKIIKDEADFYVNKAVNEGIDGKWDEAALSIAKAENIIFDVPNMSEDQEEKMFYANTNMIIQNIKGWIEKKKK
jgi:hypothetical protein